MAPVMTPNATGCLLLKALMGVFLDEQNAVSPRRKRLKALGLEPRTYGLKVRCSTD
jgi:hypothetical protein